MKRTLILSSGVVLLLALGWTLWQRVAPVAAQSGGDYDVEWSVVGSAGEQFAAGGEYQVGFTLAQAHEPMISTDGSNYTVIGGFWAGVSANRSPALSLTKSVVPVSARPGQAVTYTVAFGNTGFVPVTNVVITDALSANVTGAGFGSSGVPLTLVPGPRYVWNAPDLARGQGGLITITGVLTRPLAAQVFSNTATMTGSGITRAVTVPLTVQNVAPVADAGPDQSQEVSQTVTLDGSGSSDDNGDALTYGWAQTGGPSVTLSDAAAESPSFTAPGSAAVLTFSLVVTDSHGLADPTPDEVVVTVTNLPPVADAGSDQNVMVGAPVMLDGSGSSDPDGHTPLTYGWAQTGGPSVTLSDAAAESPSFTAPDSAAVLTFTLVVTDSHGLVDPTPDEVVVTVTELPVYYLYLPLVTKNYVVAPDLVVRSITATSDDVQVVIENQGNAPVTDEFWVEAYIDPAPAPTAVNQLWWDLGTKGMVWGVVSSALPLEPGDTMTLAVGDAYYQSDYSSFSTPLAAGTPVYVQVDTYNADTDYGAVLEGHEISGSAYNNIGRTDSVE